MDTKSFKMADRHQIARMARVLSTVLLAGLASCSTSRTPDPLLQTSALAPQAETISSDVSPEFAAAFLPGIARSIQSVRQSVSGDGLSQQIVYSNLTTAAGENMLSIAVGKTDTAEFLRPPSERRIASEIRMSLPGGKGAISPMIRDNVQGAYGYATAAFGTGGSCLYAWQFIKDVSADDVEGYRKLTRTRFAAQVRLRYCHPSIPQDRVAVLMDGLRVKKMSGETIDLLRFAAGSANPAAPPAVVTAEPQRIARAPVARVKKPVEEEEDWRQAAAVKQDDGDARPISNVAVIPLPDQTKVRTIEPDTATQQDQPVSDTSEVIEDSGSIPSGKAVLIPLPE